MLRNILSNWVGLVVAGAISFLITPVLVHGLGNFYFGIWVLVSSIVDYYGFLDLGMRTAVVRFVARSKGGNERQGLNQTLTSGLAITMVIAIVILGSSALVAAVLPRFVDVSRVPRPIFRWLVGFLGASIAVAFPARMLSSYLSGLQRYDLLNLATISTTLMRAVCFVIILRCGYGIIGVAVVTCAAWVISLTLQWILIRRADPEVVVHWSETSWRRIRELFSFGVYAFLNTVGDYLRFYVDSIVIARVLDVALITPFDIVAKLMEYMKSVVISCGSPLMSEMCALDGGNRDGEIERIFLRSIRAFTLLSGFMGFMLVLNGRELLRVWVGQSFTAYYNLLVLLSLAYIVLLSQHPSILLIIAKGRHQAMGWWSVAEGVINLSLSIYWGRRYGLFGVALGTVVPLVALRVSIQPWYTLRILSLSVRRYIAEGVGRPLLACAAFLIVCVPIVHLTHPENVLHLIATSAWQTVLFAVLALTLGMNRADREYVFQRGRQVANSVIRMRETVSLSRAA